MQIGDPQERRGRPFGTRQVRDRAEAWLREQLAEGIKPLKEIRRAAASTRYPANRNLGYSPAGQERRRH